MASNDTVPFLINGKDVTGPSSFPVTNPATQQVVHQCSSASLDTVQDAVSSAAAALPEWRKVAPGKKRDLFLKAADVMEKRKGELVGYLSEETGTSSDWGEFNIMLATDLLRDIAGRISAIQGSIPTTKEEGLSALVLKEPYGVVLAIAPWNAPYILGTRSIAYPIAAGNTAILKGSELSPRVMWAIGSVFLEAGFPAGVLNVIYHSPASAAEVTSALIKHKEIKKVNFTGSTAVGKIIARTCGDVLKPVLLELGGKAPAIVWRDADLDRAAQQCALGAYLHSGQVCMSTERIIVHKDVKGEFETKFTAAVGNIFPGKLSLISAQAVTKNQALLADAREKGAGIVGNAEAEEGSAAMKPVLVTGVTPEMDIYHLESFGPTTSMLEVETEEEALRIANDTDYGLNAAVFTEDLRRGLRMAKAIETGTVHINGMTIHDEANLPHGGVKASGFGRFNAAAGMEEWVRSKTITFRD